MVKIHTYDSNELAINFDLQADNANFMSFAHSTFVTLDSGGVNDSRLYHVNLDMYTDASQTGFKNALHNVCCLIQTTHEATSLRI